MRTLVLKNVLLLKYGQADAYWYFPDYCLIGFTFFKNVSNFQGGRLSGHDNSPNNDVAGSGRAIDYPTSEPR